MAGPWFAVLAGPAYLPAGQASPAARDAVAALEAPGATCAPCPRLPSSNSAYDAVHGVPWAWARVARDWLFRGLLVGVGIRLAGDPWGAALRKGLYGSAVIEGFVLAWIAATAPPPPPPAAPAGGWVLPAAGR